MDYIISQITASPWQAFLFYFKYIGLPFLVVFFIYGLKVWWLNWRQGKYAATLEYTLLAIDIPKENIQSPKALENMFDQISGAHSSFNFIDKWWYGKFQARFSFEIISIDGYVQFLVYTQKNFRDLVEAAIYAQYPEAEITEVEDYTENAPKEFPNKEYNLWGSEFLMTNSWVYPIQTYPFFEHPLSKDIKDPMIALTEAMGSIKKGENVWIQWIVTMTGFEWRAKCQREIDKITGKSLPPSSWREEMDRWLGGWFNDFISQIVGVFSETKTKAEKKKFGLLKLAPY